MVVCGAPPLPRGALWARIIPMTRNTSLIRRGRAHQRRRWLRSGAWVVGGGRVGDGDGGAVPCGLGTCASRSRATAGVVGAVRNIRDMAGTIGPERLKVAEGGLDWEHDQFSVKGTPGQPVTIEDRALAAVDVFVNIMTRPSTP